MKNFNKICALVTWSWSAGSDMVILKAEYNKVGPQRRCGQNENEELAVEFRHRVRL